MSPPAARRPAASPRAPGRPAAEIGADPRRRRLAVRVDARAVRGHRAASPTSSRGLGLTVEIDAAGNLIGKWDGPGTGARDGRVAPRHGPARRPVRRRAGRARRRRGGPPAAGGGFQPRGRSGSGRSWTRRAPRFGSGAVRQPRVRAARTCPRRWTPATRDGITARRRDGAQRGTRPGPARPRPTAIGQLGGLRGAAHRAGSGARQRGPRWRLSRRSSAWSG